MDANLSPRLKAGSSAWCIRAGGCRRNTALGEKRRHSRRRHFDLNVATTGHRLLYRLLCERDSHDVRLTRSVGIQVAADNFLQALKRGCVLVDWLKIRLQTLPDETRASQRGEFVHLFRVIRSSPHDVRCHSTTPWHCRAPLTSGVVSRPRYMISNSFLRLFANIVLWTLIPLELLQCLNSTCLPRRRNTLFLPQLCTDICTHHAIRSIEKPDTHSSTAKRLRRSKIHHHQEPSTTVT